MAWLNNLHWSKHEHTLSLFTPSTLNTQWHTHAHTFYVLRKNGRNASPYIFMKCNIRSKREKDKQKRGKGESQQETWIVTEGSYVGKILNMHKPFCSMFTLLLGVPSCHGNKNSTKSELMAVEVKTTVPRPFPLKIPTYVANTILNINSIIYFDCCPLLQPSCPWARLRLPCLLHWSCTGAKSNRLSLYSTR